MQLAYEWLIDNPAWALGAVIGAIIHLIMLFAPVWIGVTIGGWVYERLGNPFAIVAGIATWLYVTVLLLRASSWMSVHTLRAIEGMGLS